MPTDPKPDGIAEPRTRRWAQLADIRYGLLLGSIEHYLLTSDEQDRSDLANWAFSEMFALASFARMLTTLPQGRGVAALPFTLPTPQHLPDDEIARWGIHAARTRAAITKVQEMLADAADANDPILTSLLDSDTDRLQRITAGTSTPGTTTSFARDILPLFRPVDIEHMNDLKGLNLAEYDTVRTFAHAISKRLKGHGPIMPPPPDPPWPPTQIELFDQWITEKFPQ